MVTLRRLPEGQTVNRVRASEEDAAPTTRAPAAASCTPRTTLMPPVWLPSRSPPLLPLQVPSPPAPLPPTPLSYRSLLQRPTRPPPRLPPLKISTEASALEIEKLRT